MSTTEPGDAGWPDYLIDRARRTPRADCGIVLGSTPVVSFGHPIRPNVATLGINPSVAEFSGPAGLLRGKQRRLATLESVGVDRYENMTAAHAAEVIDDCVNYFDRRPYRWFTPLDKLLRASLGVSYFESTACHLDLVQWATDPIWGKLERPAQERLLEEDRPFLVEQLQQEHYRVVLVNGRTAMHWMERAGLVRWNEVNRLPGPPTASLCVGELSSVRFVGWSCNLQSQAGALRHAPSLAEFVADCGGTALTEPDGSDAPPGAAIERGTHVRGLDELLATLRNWLDHSDAETVGVVGRYGGTRWVSIDSPLGTIDINADTTRDAVTEFVRYVSVRGRPPLHVIANRRGKINKIVFDPSSPPTSGWFAYLREPASAPMTIDWS